MGATRSSRRGGSRDSRRAVAMNKRHPYRDMEREYVTTDISLRELSRKHGVSSHSLVVDQSHHRGRWSKEDHSWASSSTCR
jgi:hypothetical protein